MRMLAILVSSNKSIVDSVRLKRAQNPGSLEREQFDEEHPHRTALRQLKLQLLSHRVTTNELRSSSFFILRCVASDSLAF
jgi:hypothetical protein